jgi:hypothetical protein
MIRRATLLRRCPILPPNLFVKLSEVLSLPALLLLLVLPLDLSAMLLLPHARNRLLHDPIDLTCELVRRTDLRLSLKHSNLWDMLVHRVVMFLRVVVLVLVFVVTGKEERLFDDDGGVQIVAGLLCV